MKNKVNADSSLALYKYGMLLIALQSFGCWLFWAVDNLVIAFFFLVISVVFVGMHKDWKDLTPRMNRSHFFFYLIALLLYSVGNNIIGWLRIIMIVWPLYVVFVLNSKYKVHLLFFFRKALFILVSVSLLAWILYLFGINLPHTTVYYGQTAGSYHYIYENYFFFLQNISSAKALLIPRFCSVFIEPGYLGCLMAILIYQGNYKFGKGYYENWIFLIALLFTLSLAGWLLLILGYLINKMRSFKSVMTSFFAIAIIVFIIIPYIQRFNNGFNYINEAIFDRLEFDETRGTISGYNRSSEDLDQSFWTSFVYSSDLFLGNKNYIESVSDRADNEVSWTAYIINNGLLAFVFLVIYYFYPAIKCKKNRIEYWGLSLLFFLIFCQTIHMTHSIMYVSLFVFSINAIRKNTFAGDIERLTI